MPNLVTAEAVVNPTRDGDAMRWHELALQRWCYQRFFVADGYPVPVLFSAPMDAYAQFKNLWGADNNPFRYLLDLKDSNGTPIYAPYPEPPKYPLISIHRRGWSYRPSQNYSYRRWRRIAWPTVSDTVYKQDLGAVVTSRMPAAWNFRFQVDHFCLRPDTQSAFITKVMEAFWQAGGVPQTWIAVKYPGHLGMLNVRMYLDGELESVTPAEPQRDTMVEYRASFNVTIEGYVPDLNYKICPAVWSIVLNSRAPGSPEQLDQLFSTDLRYLNAKGNPVLDRRDNVPPSLDPAPGD